MQSFAQVELAVTETLLLLSTVPERGARVRLRHLIGQRLSDLADAIGLGGPFALEGEKAATALAAFRTHEPLRTLLAHGVAKVLLDRRGRWAVIIKIVAIRGQHPERTTHAFDEDEAKSIYDDIQSKSQRLCAILGQLRITARS